MAGRFNKKNNGSLVPNELRFYGVELGFFVFAAIIVLRLLFVQAWEQARYKTMAKKQYIIEIPLEGQRGLIYDRNMTYLALNEPCVSIALDKNQMKASAAAYAKKLAAVLDVPASKLRRRIRSVRGNFVWLRRRIDVDYGPRVAALNLPGIRVERDTRRVYPHHEIVAHVLGFTDADNRGISGSELKFNKFLAGQGGRVVIQRDGRGRAVPEVVVDRLDPVEGKSVVLTIDYILQTIVVDELRKTVAELNIRSGSVVVCDPRTGEILALANEPTFNPNAPAASSLDARRNRAVTDLYEPGSTFKIVPFAGLFERKLKKADDLVFCENGSYRLNGRRLRDSSPNGWLMVADVLAKSSNIGTAKLTLELGKQGLYDFVRRFGFGVRSKIDLPGEAAGIVHPLARWSSFTLPSVAIGQEIACNAVQLTMAFAAIANGGMLLQPKVLRAVQDVGGNLESTVFPETVRRVVSRKTARQITRLLERVVEKGTGKAARIPGVRIAGKTGTAQKPRADGKGYSRTEFISSFVGFFPAENPHYLILVKLDTDWQHQWASTTAAPLFKRIAEKILAYDRQLQITQRQPEQGRPARLPDEEMEGLVLPDMTYRRITSARETLSSQGFNVKVEGSGSFVAKQVPEPGIHLQPGSKITLYAFDMQRSDGFIRMPSVIGLSLREAMNRLAIASLVPVVYGHGKVVRQKPEAGAKVRAGIRSILECEAPEEFLAAFPAGRVQ